MVYSHTTIRNDVQLKIAYVTLIVLLEGRIDLCLNFGKLLSDNAIIVIALGLFINLSQLSQ